jgi:amino acid transporter
MENENKRKVDELKRTLTFKDLFFLSIGGQGPFISLIAFGTVMIEKAGILAVLSMATATLVVLMNGLVIYYLSKRFSSGGGYYTYGLYGLSQRMGFETGWMYIVYSLSYGGSLMLGGGYIFNLITGFPPIYSIIVVLIISTFLVLKGVKISSKFAEIFAGAELIILLFLSLYFLYLSGFRIYNPFNRVSLGDISLIWLGALYGIGIPTGYGSITPLAEEVKNAKSTIGKVAISSILIGGLFATLFFYSIADINFKGNLASFLVMRFGVIGDILISIVAISDGVLGGISFLTASSRVIYNMAKDNFLHKALSLMKNNKPYVAELVSILGMGFVILIPTLIAGIYGALVTVGAISGIFNLFIHSSSNVSLIRISTKRIKVKKMGELIIGVVAMSLSFYLLLNTILQVQPYIVYSFLGWMVLGFFYLESLDIIRKSQNEQEEH